MGMRVMIGVSVAVLALTAGCRKVNSQDDGEETSLGGRASDTGTPSDSGGGPRPSDTGAPLDTGGDPGLDTTVSLDIDTNGCTPSHSPTNSGDWLATFEDGTLQAGNGGGGVRGILRVPRRHRGG